jgi:hypothetical protein
MYTAYDRMFGGFPAKHTVYAPYTHMVLANPTHMKYESLLSEVTIFVH